MRGDTQQTGQERDDTRSTRRDQRAHGCHQGIASLGTSTNPRWDYPRGTTFTRILLDRPVWIDGLEKGQGEVAQLCQQRVDRKSGIQSPEIDRGLPQE